MQLCPAVTTSQLGSVRRRVVQGKSKLTPWLHEGYAIGRTVFAHHLDPLLTVDFQATLHEVQRRRNVEGAHDARDHHTSRGRRL